MPNDNTGITTGKAFRWYCPVKPLRVSQAWGIYNPAYLQFGYSRHNGLDFLEGNDHKLWWPVEDFTVYDVAWGDATGWRIKANSNSFYLFSDGKRARINLIIMHLEAMSPLKAGDVPKIGDFSGIPDSTGFSTATHIHFMLRRIDKDGNLIDKNDADNSIDPALYYTHYYAQDYDTLLQKFQSLILILQAMVGSLPTNNK